jgi:hypothetical protein
MNAACASEYLAGLRAAIFILLGDRCAVAACVVTDRRMLQIDHVGGGGNAHRRQVSGRGYLISILNDLRTKRRRYRLVCANHHALATKCRHKRAHHER